MMDKIRGLRGSVYRKMRKEEPGIRTRAGRMLAILKSQRGEQAPFAIHPVRSVITLPQPVHITNANIVYPLIRPYAYANIKLDKAESLMVYNVVEPRLTQAEQHVLNKIKEGLVQVIDVSFEDIKETGVMTFLEENVNRLIKEYDFGITRKEYVKIMYYIYRDFVGLNRIEPLMHDPYIEDVGCLPEDEKLFVREEEKIQLLKIKDVVGLDNKNSTTIKLPDKDIEVLSFNPDTLKAEYKRVIGLLRKENRYGYYFDIKTQGGNHIKVSPDHPMLVLAAGGIKEKRADSLTEGDYLLRLKRADMQSSGNKRLDLIEAFAQQPGKVRVRGTKYLIKSNIEVAKKLGVSNRLVANWKCSDTVPLWAYLKLEKDKTLRRTLQIGLQGGKNWIPAAIDLDEDFALFVGFFLAEGYYETAGISFAFGTHEKEFHELISHLGQKLFGATTRIIEKKKNCTIVYCGGVILRRVFEHILNIEGDSHKKKVPEMAYSWDTRLLVKLVEGYFLGDGYFRISETTKKAVIATASRDLVMGIRFILYRLGIFTRVDERNRKFANTWEIAIEGGSVLDKFAKDILGEFPGANASSTTTELYPSFLFNRGDYSNTDRKIVGHSIRQSGKLGTKFAHMSSNTLLQKLLNGDVHPIKVTDINPVPYTEPFYDIEVEGNKNFMHGDFIFTHNCDGVGIPVYIIHQKFGSMRTSVVYNDIEELREFVTKLAERCDRYISYAEPLLDGTLKDGTRVQASLASDVTTRGPTFSLRKFREIPLTPVDMVKLNTASPEMLAYLWFIVENGANILVAGGVSTGKTSFLNAISMFIPADLKIVSIEDTRELQLPHENWIPGVSRPGFAGSGVGEVSMFQLLRESFRQNPDYLIVGEIRGKEAYVMFQGMASIPGNEKVAVLNDEHLKFIPIGDMENKAYKTFTIDAETGEIKIAPVKARVLHKPQSTLYKITTKSGREITTTAYHSLFTFNRGIRAVEAEKLRKGDTIVVPARIPSGFADIEHTDLTGLAGARIFAPEYFKQGVKKLGFEKASRICGVKSISDYYANFKRAMPASMRAEKFFHLMKEAGIEVDKSKIQVKFLRKSRAYPALLRITPELLRLVGYYISEGSLNKSGKTSKICLYNKNEAILDDMRRCVQAVAGTKIRERITEGWGTCTELSFSHKVIFEFLLQHCGKNSQQKNIPDFIYGLSKEKIGAFLSALFSGDGYFSRTKFGYYTSSRELANNLAHLLLAYGIVARIITRKSRSRKGGFEYDVMFYRREEREEFLKFAKPAGKKAEIKDVKRIKKTDRYNDVFLDIIKSIEKIELSQAVPVYDLVVPGTQSFIGGFGGIALHNSGHPSISTMHAGSVDDLLKRLQTRPINLSIGLLESLDAVLIMVHARERGKSARRVKEIVEIESIDAVTGNPRTIKIFAWIPHDDAFEYRGDSWLLHQISTEKGYSMNYVLKELARRKKFIDWMAGKNLTGVEEQAKYINLYYKNPEVVDKLLRGIKVEEEEFSE